MWRRRERVMEWPEVAAGYQLRLGRAEEQERLAAIERLAAVLYQPYGVAEFFGHSVCRTHRFAEALAEERVWVAATAGGDEPVGFAMAEDKRPHAYLAELDVEPAHGQQGLGSALLEAVERWAAAGRAPALWLTTQANIPWNAPFYQRRGYAQISAPRQPHFIREILARQAAIGFPMVHRVAMSKPLPR